jgi:hypothetical protein
MTDVASILILSSCTATKATDHGGRELRAEQLYTGQQHRRLMRGVDVYRSAGQPAGTLDLQIVSAKHGVVASQTPLRSYNASFSGMRRQQLRRKATRLHVPRAVAELLRPSRRLALLLLGDDYMQAAAITETTTLGAPTIVLTSPRRAARLPQLPGLHVVALDNRDAQRFSCGLVALKGELAARLLTRLGESPGTWTPLDRASLLTWLENAPSPAAVIAAEDALAA